MGLTQNQVKTLWTIRK